MSVFVRDLLIILFKGSLMVGAVLVVVFFFNMHYSGNANSAEFIYTIQGFMNEFYSDKLTNYQLKNRQESLQDPKIKYKLIGEGEVIDVKLNNGTIDLIVDMDIWIVCTYDIKNAKNIVKLNKKEKVYVTGIFRRIRSRLFLYLDNCEVERIK